MTEPRNHKKIHGDGVSTADAGGRIAGGQSGGGAYKNQGQVEVDPDANGFMGHGGQTDMRYRGTGDFKDGDDNPNAVADKTD